MSYVVLLFALIGSLTVGVLIGVAAEVADDLWERHIKSKGGALYRCPL
jgi:hypothetical protein